MKKLTSILLSAIIMLTATVGFNFTAYAGAYDTVSKARNYTIGSSINGYFDSRGSNEFIKFTLNESGKIQMTAQGSNSYQIEFYQENELDSYIMKLYVNYNNDLGMSNKECSFNLLAGTYYLKLIIGDGNNSYNIRTSFTASNESFKESVSSNNNVIGNANDVALDTTYQGMLGENDSVDFYRFTVSSGSYQINIKSDGYIMFAVYTTSGKSVNSYQAYANESTKNAESTQTISLDAGTYCLKIYEEFNIYTYGSGYNRFYSFSINSPHQHSYNYSYTVAPTYTSQGYDVFACSCGATDLANFTPVKKLGKVNLKSLSSSKKKHTIKATWSKKSGASGYQIYYSKTKNFKKVIAKKTVKGSKTTSCVGKNFTKGKKYYVKVRAYKNVNGHKVYGKWSNVKTVKCK